MFSFERALEQNKKDLLFHQSLKPVKVVYILTNGFNAKVKANRQSKIPAKKKRILIGPPPAVHATQHKAKSPWTDVPHNMRDLILHPSHRQRSVPHHHVLDRCKWRCAWRDPSCGSSTHPLHLSVIVAGIWTRFLFVRLRVVRLLDFMLVFCSSSSSSSLLLSSSPPPAQPQRAATSSVPCWASTASSHGQCSLPDCSLLGLNREQPRPVFPTGPQPRAATTSVPCRASTANICGQCSLPHPTAIFCGQCSLPDLNPEQPRPVFPAGPQPWDRMSERVPEEMSDRMSEDMSDRMPQDMSDRMSEDMSERMPQDMSERMSDRMSEAMSERMSEDMSETAYIAPASFTICPAWQAEESYGCGHESTSNGQLCPQLEHSCAIHAQSRRLHASWMFWSVMAGITRSKVIWVICTELVETEAGLSVDRSLVSNMSNISNSVTNHTSHHR